jgi:hypothetical protein
MKMPETRKPQLKVIDRMEEKGSVEYVLELPRNGSNNAPETGPDIQTVVTGFAELDDGTLLELVEDPADANNIVRGVERGKGRVYRWTQPRRSSSQAIPADERNF